MMIPILPVGTGVMGSGEERAEILISDKLSSDFLLDHTLHNKVGPRGHINQFQPRGVSSFLSSLCSLYTPWVIGHQKPSLALLTDTPDNRCKLGLSQVGCMVLPTHPAPPVTASI